MKVVIDATPLLVRSAGVKNYLYHWIRHLQPVAAPHTLCAFPFLRQLGELRHDRSTLSRPATLWRLGLVGLLNRWDHGSIGWFLHGADVFHASNLIRDVPSGAAITATVHDLTCWLLPELHTEGNILADRLFAERIVPRAHRFVAVSECTRRDAICLWGLEARRVEVIYPGIDEAYFRVSAAEGRQVAQAYGIDKPYVLFVGSIEPRKNVDRLVQAYESLPASLQQEYSLVLAGPVGWKAQQTLERLRAARAEVRYLGYVPERDLPALTAGATVFVYPSLYEGFGFPVAQAMACGVPVITSDRSSLPEITGGTAMLVNPESTRELAQALEALLVSARLRQRLAAAGRSRARMFSWERCAEQSWRFFERAVQGS